jgi:DNA polymerase-3 subunit alpha
VANKYGRDNVCQIITYNTMKSKMVLKDVGRAMGFKPFETDKITKTISDDLKMTIDKALQESKEFQEIYQQSSRHKELIDMSRQLEGLARNTGVHAAGVIIAPEPVTNFGPLYKDNKKDAPKEVVCLQYAKEEAEKIGLLKFDFLGLKNLTTIQRTLELIEESLGFRLDLDAAIADFSDPSTYELFQNGETEGVFQFESSGMKRLLRQLKPTRFEDFIALNALYRPGPLGSGMDQLFIERAHGAKVSYELPALKPILEETHGVILYQEQVMKIAQVLGGFTLGQADELRRAMGKKKIEVMDRMKQTFLEGAKEKGFPEDACARIFDQMAEFAKYGFNKSHSAAYSLISYKTAYLKANYPIYFMTALLSMDKDRTEKIVHYMDRCHAMGIQVQPPDFRFSRDSFSVEGKTIRFGLGAIKGLGDAAIRSILSIPNRHEVDSFESIFEHLDFKTINKSILIKLIHSGAMDFCNQPRQAMAEAAEAMMAWGAQVQKERQGGQMTLFDLDPEMKRCFVQIGTQEYPRQELLKLEKDVLGLYLTGHPLADYLDLIEKTTNFTPIELPDKQDNDLVTIAGVLQELTRRTTKRGDDMASFKILDHKGSCDAVLFPEAFAQVRHLLQADELYVFKGHISRDQVAVIECIPLQEWVRYCQDNPAQHVQEKVKGTTSGDTTTFAKTAIGERLSLGALLHSVQTRELKRGQEMAMLRLEDERGALEGVVYPKTLKQLKHKLKEGEILIFSGCVGQGKFGPQFEIEDVYNIAQWQERRYRQCTLSLPDSTPDTLVEELVHYTSRHPGQCRIHLMIRSQDESILVELPQSFLPDQSFPALLAPYDDIKVTFQ